MMISTEVGMKKKPKDNVVSIFLYPFLSLLIVLTTHLTQKSQQ